MLKGKSNNSQVNNTPEVFNPNQFPASRKIIEEKIKEKFSDLQKDKELLFVATSPLKSKGKRKLEGIKSFLGGTNKKISHKKKINKKTSKKAIYTKTIKVESKNGKITKITALNDKGKEVKPPKTGKHPGGRPTIFTQKLADQICEKLAMGYSMRSVSKMEGIPSMETMFRWIREKDEFREQYEKAKQESSDAMAEEILDIADDGTNDLMTRTGKNGVEYEVTNNEVIQRSRLRVDTRKWLMAKMKPKIYGEKLDLSSGGNPINNPYATKSLAELKKIVEGMESEEQIRSKK